MAEEEKKAPGKGSMKWILIIGAVLVVIVIIILLWQKSKEEEDQGPPDPTKHQAKVEWYDYVDRSEKGQEKWIGHPAPGYWTAIEHRWPVALSGVEFEYWSLSVFPYPGGNPYTGQGSQIGLGGSKSTLQELWECQILHEHLLVRGYTEGWHWLRWMGYTVFPNEFGLVVQ
ncbi:MAG: hypothetical protein JSW41_03870 [Candidatus Aenigmatarchaeota archaeon]|nr:MAG: hypothetical protein JSW41_03870 [Candidatus Aenigmarchaeota archaeon]